MKKILIMSFFCSCATSVGAQQISTGREIRALLAELPYEQCIEVQGKFSLHAELSTSQDTYTTHLAGFVVKGVELMCEASRYSVVEIPRLERERDELVASATRLEEKWNTANRIDPVKFADFPGRDRSQRQNLLDAEKMEKTISSHERESERLFGLGEKSIDLALNADPGGAADLIRRLLGELPPPSA